MVVDRFLAPWTPQLLSVLRIVSGLLLLQFGTAKILKFPAHEYFQSVEIASLYGIAGLIELAGGALLVAGLFTRLVAFILAGEMAFAYFLDHAPHSFFPIVNDGTLAVLFCFVFLYLAAAGPGAWSIDSYLARATVRS
jgi:putative oxidoreductase